MKSQFIQDVEAFAQQMAERLPSHRKSMIQSMLCDEDVQRDVVSVIEELI